LDRPFVQKELQWAHDYIVPIITVFEAERRRPAFFDYGALGEAPIFGPLFGRNFFLAKLGKLLLEYRKN
jgi:hypothetical protein